MRRLWITMHLVEDDYTPITPLGYADVKVPDHQIGEQEAQVILDGAVHALTVLGSSDPKMLADLLNRSGSGRTKTGRNAKKPA